MKAKLLNTELEIRLARTICHSSTLRNYCLAQLFNKRGIFGYAPCDELANRIRAMVRAGKKVHPRLMSADPALSQSTRNIILSKRSEHEVFTSKSEVTEAVAELEKYRRTRVLFESAEQVSAGIERGEDSETLTAVVEGALASAKTTMGLDAVRFGSVPEVYKTDPFAAARRVIHPAATSRIGTGLVGFDARTKGLARGNLVILMSPRGGGKSSLSLDMSIHQYRGLHLNIGVFNFELPRDEILARILANLTGIDNSRIMAGDTTRKERLVMSAAIGFMARVGREHRCKYDIHTDMMNVSDIAAVTKAMGYDVIYVDYLTLIAASAGQENMQQLDRMSHDAWALKTLAKSADCLVVTMAHMTEDFQVKYSRAVENHADVVWGWRLTRSDKREGIAKIRQLKARGFAEFDFALRMNLSTHRWSSMSTEALEDDFEPTTAMAEQQNQRRGGRRNDEEKEAEPRPVRSRKLSERKAADLGGL